MNNNIYEEIVRYTLKGFSFKTLLDFGEVVIIVNYHPYTTEGRKDFLQMYTGTDINHAFLACEAYLLSLKES